MNAKCRQLFEDAVKAVILGSCGSPSLAIAAPENSDPILFHTDHIASPKAIETAITTPGITVRAAINPYSTSTGLSTRADAPLPRFVFISRPPPPSPPRPHPPHPFIFRHT